MWAHFDLLLQATLETSMMVFFAGGASILMGIPLGVFIFLTRRNQFLSNRVLYSILNIIINIGRSIPFIILMVSITPFTRWLVGSSIGTIASLVPLALSTIPFIARMTENALIDVPDSLIETAKSMGGSSYQIVIKVLLPESLPTLISGMTLAIVTLVGYTAMSGTLGGGGLGSIAINYGYQRFDVVIMLETVCILIVMVQLIQWCGDRLSLFFAHR
ncbi:MAG: ABC transporter permease [Endozoicomonadaceae bacterium]|nr:ABC transporter permease [Endozoicomonadaceae bacterium]